MIINYLIPSCKFSPNFWIIQNSNNLLLKLGNIRFSSGGGGEEDGMSCEVIRSVVDGELWRRSEFSYESEHDLGDMVSDFLENGSGDEGGGGSAGGDYWCGSDGDSGFSDLHLLADKISFLKRSVDQYESDLQSVTQSLLLSMGDDKDVQLFKPGQCTGSCIRYALLKLLQSSGYDAAVCASKWNAGNKLPGGDHEYIDVVKYKDDKTTERLIIDVDFRSHFEIARAVESYDKLLKSLPVIFVGTLTKLKQFLQVMADATRVSLKQNSMPLPPWRSLAYLQAKWLSHFQRYITPEVNSISNSTVTSHKQCVAHLRRLQSSLHILIEKDKLLKPMNIDSSRRQNLRR